MARRKEVARPGVVINRKRGQKILLDDGTVITVVSTFRSGVDLRVFVPQGRGVWREEIAPPALVAQAGGA